ncbi:hypothetical protein Clacol_007886 [Clathrus columnatus]|uniref:F-box domain-containing protein n=1 Tax=Clathrus columnatus TaxID=1419009 RepID=A0AAV5ANY4_9AGAM|nr:hypothetical protein Clacol_007886 [Clathrus columnatus]
MHPIFKVKEMVDQILSWLPPSSLAATALVNRIWFYSSLPNVWRYVRIVLANEYDFPSLRKVTQLRSDNMEYLFPNLRSLRFDSRLIESPPDLGLLISPTLQNVGLSFFNLPLTFFGSCCDTLATRVKSLQLLQICFDEPLSETAMSIPSFNEVLKSSASTLIHAQLPQAFLTEETLRQLGRCRKLYDLRIGASFELMFDEGWSLSISIFTGSHGALCRKFIDRYTSSFSSLAAIEWRECGDIDVLPSIVTTISKTCPQLEMLTLGESDMDLTEHHLPEIVPWETFRVLLRCLRLTDLSLHCCRVSMTSDDLVELLTSRLYFTRTPWQTLHIYTVEPLSISDFLLFAKYCPYIKTLGIHFDGRSITDNSIKEVRTQTSTRYIPPPELLLPYGISQAQPDHEGPNKLASIISIEFAFSALDPELVDGLVECLFEMCDGVPSIHGWNSEWEAVSSYLWLKAQQRNPPRITFVTWDESMEIIVDPGDIWC